MQIPLSRLSGGRTEEAAVNSIPRETVDDSLDEPPAKMHRNLPDSQQMRPELTVDHHVDQKSAHSATTKAAAPAAPAQTLVFFQKQASTTRLGKESQPTQNPCQKVNTGDNEQNGDAVPTATGALNTVGSSCPPMPLIESIVPLAAEQDNGANSPEAACLTSTERHKPGKIRHSADSPGTIPNPDDGAAKSVEESTLRQNIWESNGLDAGCTKNEAKSQHSVCPASNTDRQTYQTELDASEATGSTVAVFSEHAAKIQMYQRGTDATEVAGTMTTIGLDNRSGKAFTNSSTKKTDHRRASGKKNTQPESHDQARLPSLSSGRQSRGNNAMSAASTPAGQQQAGALNSAHMNAVIGEDIGGFGAALKSAEEATQQHGLRNRKESPSVLNVPATKSLKSSSNPRKRSTAEVPSDGSLIKLGKVATLVADERMVSMASPQIPNVIPSCEEQDVNQKVKRVASTKAKSRSTGTEKCETPSASTVSRPAAEAGGQATKINRETKEMRLASHAIASLSGVPEDRQSLYKFQTKYQNIVSSAASTPAPVSGSEQPTVALQLDGRDAIPYRCDLIAAASTVGQNEILNDAVNSPPDGLHQVVNNADIVTENSPRR